MLSFASSTALLLRRPRPSPRWVCASGPVRGRGYWNLDSAPGGERPASSPVPGAYRADADGEGRGRRGHRGRSGRDRDEDGAPRQDLGGHGAQDERGRGRDAARQAWGAGEEGARGGRSRRRRDHAPARGTRREFESPEGEEGEPSVPGVPGRRGRDDREWSGGARRGGRGGRLGYDVRGRDGEFLGRGGGSAQRGFDRESGGDWGERSVAPTELQRALAAVDMDLVYGVSPVLGALTAGRRHARMLYVQDRKEGSGGGPGPARKEGHNAAVAQIHRFAASQGVTIKSLPKGDLNVLSRDRPHQGFVLHASKLEYEDVLDVGHAPEAPESVEDGSMWENAPVWLVLDEVSDPQNLGALARSAHFLGAAGVVACKRNSSALTPAVSKASAGAVESMAIRGVASMPKFLRRAKEQGWRVVGAAVAGDAVTTSALEVGVPTLLVMGSEGRGLRPMVRAECDVLVQIGGRASVVEAGVDSLNVSVAGAILLHTLLGA